MENWMQNQIWELHEIEKWRSESDGTNISFWIGIDKQDIRNIVRYDVLRVYNWAQARAGEGW